MSPVKTTSIRAYMKSAVDGKLKPQRLRIYDCLMDSAVPLTRRQISKLTGIEINAVTGRVNSMISSERPLIKVAYIGNDPATGNRAEFLEPVWPQPKQREFKW